MLQTKKEKKNEYNRLRYQRKKEEIKAKQRLYAHENREYRSEQKKLYYKSSDGIKFRRIGHWRNRGVFDHFNDNHETLYKIYQSTKFCENCNVELNIEEDSRTKKCLDHCHTSGYFRNILCCSCNRIRN